MPILNDVDYMNFMSRVYRKIDEGNPRYDSGYSNSAVTCPGNILGDISRLEVLIGGKRAGNNSPEKNK